MYGDAGEWKHKNNMHFPMVCVHFDAGHAKLHKLKMEVY